MVIRKAEKAEFDDVIAFYHELIDSMRDAEFRPKWEKDIYPTRQFIYDSIEKEEMHVAVADDGIISAMVVNHDSADGYEKAPWKMQADKNQIAVIHILAVSTRHQRRGAAKEMVAYAIDKSRKNGMKAIRLDVLAENKPAHILYASMGFINIGTIKLYYEDTGLTEFALYELAF